MVTESGTRSDRAQAARTATLVALPLAVVVFVGMFLFSGGLDGRSDPKPAATGAVSVSLSHTSAGSETVCRALIAKLPHALAGHAGRPVTPDTAAERAAAWGDPAITLTCGVGEPARATGAATVFDAAGVRWLLTEDDDASVLKAVDREVAIEVRVPDRYSGQPKTLLAPLASVITSSVPAR